MLEISTCMLEVANQTLRAIDMKQKQDYISEETWQKIVARQRAHENGNLPALKDPSSQIKNLARRDKRNAILESIQGLPNQREKWSGVKNMKKRSPAQVYSHEESPW